MAFGGSGSLASPHQNFDLVRNFVSSAENARTMADLRELIGYTSRDLGFDHFAIVHHIRFGHPTTDKIRLSNYPLEWLGLLRQGGGFEEPVLKAAERACSGFRWSRLHELIKLNVRQQKYMGGRSIMASPKASRSRTIYQARCLVLVTLR